jgi:DNA-binding MarR family transcriptional regulator
MCRRSDNSVGATVCLDDHIIQLDDYVKLYGYSPAMATTTDLQAATLGQGLVRLAIAVDAAYTRASRELGLTAQQCELLCAVGFEVGEDGRWVATNRGTPIGELAAELHCDQSNASRLVDRAAARGLLARRRGADIDGRVTLVELTSKGHRRLDRFISILSQSIDSLFADWPPERRHEALAIVLSLAETLESGEVARTAEPGRRSGRR